VRSIKDKLARRPRDRDPAQRRNSRIEAAGPAIPELVCGSADLTGSNNTKR